MAAQLARELDVVFEALTDPDATWAAQATALRDLQDVVQSDLVWNSLERQAQLATTVLELMGGVLSAFVKDTRSAVARAACTTVESLSETLGGALDPLCDVRPMLYFCAISQLDMTAAYAAPQLLLPPLLLQASSPTPAVGRCAEGAVVALVRNCGAKQAASLIRWSCGGIRNGYWAQYRSASKTQVRRQVRHCNNPAHWSCARAELCGPSSRCGCCCTCLRRRSRERRMKG